MCPETLEYTPKYFTQVAPGNGIGGFDLHKPEDRVFAFDYESSGKLDHLVLYRPDSGVIHIVKNNGSRVYAGNNGIGGFDLQKPEDRMFAFDYESSGKLDHLVLYRPDSGVIHIVKNNGGIFSSIYVGNNGIGSFDLQKPEDRVFAFDYDGSGKLDHLVLYRPGSGVIHIVKNNGGIFSSIYAGKYGIGGFDLKKPVDRVFAFDYESSGKLDNLVLYRPDSGVIYIVKNNGGIFSPIYTGKNGIGSFDLQKPEDRVLAFDYESSGKLDYLVLYRPGSGVIHIVKNNGGIFSSIYAGKYGIGGFDLKKPVDRVFAFDYESSGKLDNLVLYRPDSGVINIVKNEGGNKWSSLPLLSPDPVANITEITKIEYDIKAARILKSDSLTLRRKQVINNTDNPQTTTHHIEEQVTDTFGWSDSFSHKLGVTLQASVPIPMVEGGEISFSTSYEYTTTHESNCSISKTMIFSDDTPIDVPPHTRSAIYITAMKSTLSVPYTLTATAVLQSGVKKPITTKGTYEGANTYDIKVEFEKFSPITDEKTNTHEIIDVT